MDEIEYIQTELSTSVTKYELLSNGSHLDFGSFLTELKSNQQFQLEFAKILAESKYDAFRWECPPITDNRISIPFEFVLVHAPSFANRMSNGSAFEKYFKENDVNTFLNLGRDAMMIVLSPQVSNEIYGHIASFLRFAPAKQIQALWKSVAREVLDGLSNSPIWLNTAGGGVPWLHVRLDKRPKYYHYQPYKSLNA